MSDLKSFQVNLKGVIELLSGHIYSGPQVYIRELLQNGVDAITARKLHIRDTEGSGEYHGKIHIELIPGKGSGTKAGPPTMIVTDNGIGLTEEETHRFLATIGQSSKRDTIDRSSFIGQFGIGMLSAFMVCEEIVLISQSMKEGQKAVKWVGKSDGTYQIETLDRQLQPGSQVYLTAKTSCYDFFEWKFVQEIASHYGKFLANEVEVTQGEQSTLINQTPPWVHQWDDQIKQQLLEEYSDPVGRNYLDVIRLESEEGGVEGVAFVLPEQGSTKAKRKDSVYLKGMLVSDSVENLLPEWAFFVRCILNATDLSPTASRESFHEDDGLSLTRANMGTALREYLMKLAKESPEKLDDLIETHFLSMKALAAEDEDFCRLFLGWLPMETNMGSLTINEIREKDSQIRYVTSRDEFRQISNVASTQGFCLVNAYYIYDAQLVEQIPEVFPGATIQRIDVNEFAQDFDELSLQEKKEVEGLVSVADQVLQPYQCRSDIKKFRPEDLPALYTTNKQASFFRDIQKSKDVADDLFSGVLDSIEQSIGTDGWARLCLNYSNPLVQRIALIKDHRLLERMIEMVYVQSLLMGHHPLNKKETDLLNNGLMGMIELVMSKED